MEEMRRPQEQGPLPRSREAVDWWLKKWGRTEPLTGQDVERLIEANGGIAEGLTLVGRNIQSAFLYGSNLQGANLWEAKLQGADLNFAQLQGAALLGANLQGAGLYYANLNGADLSGANLQGADLGYADLRGADLRMADLKQAHLRNSSISRDTNLEGVEWDPKYKSALERRGDYERGDYEAASAVYRRLKEWYRGAGMLTIAGEFHYREREASRKAKGQRLIRQFKAELAGAWRRLKGKDTSASAER